MSTNQFKPSLLDFWIVVKNYLFFIFCMTFLSTIISVVMVFFIIKPTYEATGSILILPQSFNGSQNNLLSNLNSPLGNLGSLRSLLGSSGNFSSPLNELKSILKSRTLTERVLKHINVKNLEEIKELSKNIDEEKVKRHITSYIQQKLIITPPSSKHGDFKITMQLKDKVLVAKLVNRYIIDLEEYLQSLLSTQTEANKEFLEKQLVLMENRLESVEEELLSFQKSNKTVELSEEIKQYIKYLADLEAEDLAARTAFQENQAKLNSLENQSTQLNPAWNDVFNELQLTRSSLQQRQLEINKARTKYQSLLRNMPIQALNLARLKRKVNIQNRLFILLNQQVETLRIESKRIKPIFKVLDPAIEADKPIAPVKKIVVGITFIGTLFCSIGFALLHYYWQQLKKERII